MVTGDDQGEFGGEFADAAAALVDAAVLASQKTCEDCGDQGTRSHRPSMGGAVGGQLTGWVPGRARVSQKTMGTLG
jgi:hypothetical protein